jgi:hypothetical protein
VSSVVVSGLLGLATSMRPPRVLLVGALSSSGVRAPCVVVPEGLVLMTSYHLIAVSGWPLQLSPFARSIHGGIRASEQADNMSSMSLTPAREQSSRRPYMDVPHSMRFLIRHCTVKMQDSPQKLCAPFVVISECLDTTVCHAAARICLPPLQCRYP